MKKTLAHRAAVLALAASLVLSTAASALFGRKQTETVQEGAPQVRALEIRTYRDIPYQAEFLTAGERTDVTYSVVDPPRKGDVTVEGASFTYVPKEGTTGTDRFTYAATDEQGRASLPAEVTVTIEKTRSGVTYSDMEGNSAAAAAQELAEEGIFVGTKIGSRYCFEPEETVSRSEFLAMALEAAGREVTPVSMTGFCDDGAIPAWAKDYAAAGVADGILQGTATAEGVAFRGNDPISYNAAAAMLDRMLDMGDVELDVWYADRDAAPSWAAQAVGNMEALNVLEAGSFGSQTMEAPVTRADAARMISSVRALLREQEEPASGFLSWFKK